MRIIGVELRLRFISKIHGPQQKELLVLPCNLEVSLPEIEPGYPNPQINGTIHTDIGDFQIQDVQFPTYALFDTSAGLKVKNT